MEARRCSSCGCVWREFVDREQSIASSWQVRTTAGAALMDLPGSSFFYAFAALAMAFVGFTSVVVVLYQSTGKQLSDFHILLTRLFVELGLMATAFAMLAPTLSMLGLAELHVWQLSSAVMLASLGPWLVYYPFRRRVAAPEARLPLRWYIMTSIGVITCVFLALNLGGWIFASGPGPLVAATVFVLSYATVAYIGTYSLFTRQQS